MPVNINNLFAERSGRTNSSFTDLPALLNERKGLKLEEGRLEDSRERTRLTDIRDRNAKTNADRRHVLQRDQLGLQERSLENSVNSLNDLNRRHGETLAHQGNVLEEAKKAREARARSAAESVRIQETMMKVDVLVGQWKATDDPELAAELQGKILRTALPEHEDLFDMAEKYLSSEELNSGFEKIVESTTKLSEAFASGKLPEAEATAQQKRDLMNYTISMERTALSRQAKAARREVIENLVNSTDDAENTVHHNLRAETTAKANIAAAGIKQVAGISGTPMPGERKASRLTEIRKEAEDRKTGRKGNIHATPDEVDAEVADRTNPDSPNYDPQLAALDKLIEGAEALKRLDVEGQGQAANATSLLQQPTIPEDKLPQNSPSAVLGARTTGGLPGPEQHPPMFDDPDNPDLVADSMRANFGSLYDQSGGDMNATVASMKQLLTEQPDLGFFFNEEGKLRWKKDPAGRNDAIVKMIMELGREFNQKGQKPPAAK